MTRTSVRSGPNAGLRLTRGSGMGERGRYPRSVVEEFVVFAGSASQRLGAAVTAYLDIPLGSSETLRFSEGNLFVRVPENVRGRDKYIIQSTAFPENDKFMELLFWIDVLKRAGAGSVTAVIPYFTYAKGDQRTNYALPSASGLRRCHRPVVGEADPARERSALVSVVVGLPVVVSVKLPALPTVKVVLAAEVMLGAVPSEIGLLDALAKGPVATVETVVPPPLFGSPASYCIESIVPARMDSPKSNPNGMRRRSHRGTTLPCRIATLRARP